MWCLLFSVLFLGGYSLSEAKKLPLPPYIKACHKDDPNIDACALQHAKESIPQMLNGDKTYGIPILNPLELESISVETGGNLTIILSKVKVFGLDKIDVTKIKVDLPGKALQFEFKGEKLEILGKYQMDGKILVIPLKGNGDCSLIASNVDIKFNLKYDLVERDGDEYIQLGENNIDIDLDNLQLQFDNLFNGNEELGKSTNKILNEEWKAVYAELKPAISKTISTIAVTIVTRVTERVPYKQIFV
ncbi:unnamed protein product [Phaedon cochleariae]|uniref:Uncharacterized protein n=1 Tax=Phaedon cochleariae TaxID=80249 RepID=A0A9P0DST7_PHACE|nr:unnamed protein product [Phaedon cochleariae]